MACRFPGAGTPAEFWEILKQGRDVVSEISADRWGTDYYLHRNRTAPGKSYTFSAGVLNDVEHFDADFFGISPREASQMDPQQRLLLELAWEALDDGGQVAERLAGSNCAVYIGVSSMDWAHRRVDDPSSADAYFMSGATLSIAANRISYVLDLQGPSVSIDTACSSARSLSSGSPRRPCWHRMGVLGFLTPTAKVTCAPRAARCCFSSPFEKPKRTAI